MYPLLAPSTATSQRVGSQDASKLFFVVMSIKIMYTSIHVTQHTHTLTLALTNSYILRHQNFCGILKLFVQISCFANFYLDSSSIFINNNTAVSVVLKFQTTRITYTFIRDMTVCYAVINFPACKAFLKKLYQVFSFYESSQQC